MADRKRLVPHVVRRVVIGYRRRGTNGKGVVTGVGGNDVHDDGVAASPGKGRHLHRGVDEFEIGVIVMEQERVDINGARCGRANVFDRDGQRCRDVDHGVDHKQLRRTIKTKNRVV